MVLMSRGRVFIEVVDIDSGVIFPISLTLFVFEQQLPIRLLQDDVVIFSLMFVLGSKFGFGIAPRPVRLG